ncbi:ribosome biogenesis GTPase Der [Rickettsiales endosymbiont of Peranema trichophorum]|uniref:ribosome biogenesis GTPase Der n=1 Tax=Rickettsiales endosymbiont of Peranema trichophorum TaxID=2486577 RepID=UPI0010230924|nr:ribosome biogenesis GTPase Der [Rickettsiales endosymbiont of Peranema trichophorum]RZI47282.1 ribosome biogenesis GTPase Der [Rickettsiales endosymbiont of Peranema trichophorum]
MKRIVIAGRPNVGKSSLFNRLVGRKVAIVDDHAGVTRDHVESTLHLEDSCYVSLVDTAGFQNNVTTTASGLESIITRNLLNLINTADLILFTIDARSALTSDDLDIATMLRKSGKKVIVIVNKSEGKHHININDICGFGFEARIFVSAAHGIGIHEIRAAIFNHVSWLTVPQEDVESPGITSDTRSISLSIIGRPNVGKSTLFNNMVGFERVITSNIPGTTRDSIAYTFTYKDTLIKLVDTAGIRKRTNIQDSIEELSVTESINAIKRSDVILLVVSAEQPMEKQDLTIAKTAIDYGKPLILVFNKIDLVNDYKEFEAEMKYLTSKTLSDVDGLKISYISALKKKEDIKRILDDVVHTYRLWNTKIGTHKLNKWLAQSTANHIPPISRHGRRLKFKYITQIKTRPPTFNLFCNIVEDIPGSYIRYLKNTLREKFSLYGVPIQLHLIKSFNPYHKKTHS